MQLVSVVFVVVFVAFLQVSLSVETKKTQTWADVKECFTKSDCVCPKTISAKAQQFVEVIKRCVGGHREEFWAKIFNCTNQKETNACWKVTSSDITNATIAGSGSNVPDFVQEAAQCWKDCTVHSDCFKGCTAKEDPEVNKALRSCVPELKAQMTNALKNCHAAKPTNSPTDTSDAKPTDKKGK